MCGIAGAIAFAPDAKYVNESTVRRLTNIQRHRGPDGEGHWCSHDKRVVLGHRRLAIIDAGLRAAQPMSDVSARWVVSYNGEIYNYRALRSELESLGHRFSTESDTEVLINVIARWGEKGLTKLRGMYAFALWDSAERELWLARDPYGIKPLYVAEAGGIFWFGSQARALATCVPIDTHRDAAGLVGFYLWGFVPEPFSWWEGIRMFPAGHVQRIQLGKPISKAKPYDCIQDVFAAEAVGPISTVELHKVLLDSVRHHLVSDVPVGLFLSSGIDSTALATLCADLGVRLRSVTLTFKEFAGTANDEAPIAEATAKHAGMDHVTVCIDREEFEDLLDDFLRSMDQPTTDGLNAYLVSRAASMQGLKVALSGLGGDELFGGYPSFKQIPKLLNLGKYDRFNRWADRHMHTVFNFTRPLAISPKIECLFSHNRDIASAYLLRRSLHLEHELELVMDREWLNEGIMKLATTVSLEHIVEPIRTSKVSTHGQISVLESCWYMRNQLLRDADWASMAHGLEVRVPFVDTRLLKRLAPAISSAQPPTKHDLCVATKITREEIYKRPKTGFVTPVRQWVSQRTGTSARGLRGWAAVVHGYFRTSGRMTPSRDARQAA